MRLLVLACLLICSVATAQDDPPETSLVTESGKWSVNYRVHDHGVAFLGQVQAKNEAEARIKAKKQFSKQLAGRPLILQPWQTVTVHR